MKEKKYWIHLDFLRFLAVALVLFVHFTRTKLNLIPSEIASFGEYGVDIFFTISGFLITYILIDQKERKLSNSKILKGFYAKRLLRLFPIYYILLLFTWLLEYFTNLDFNFTNNWYWYVLYLSNFLISILDQPSPQYLGPTWSLSVEEQFYIFWPLILLFCSARNLKFVAILMIIVGILSEVVLQLYGMRPNYARFITSSNLHTLGCGVLLAYLFYYKHKTLYAFLYNKIHIIVLVSSLLFIAMYVINYNKFQPSLFIIKQLCLVCFSSSLVLYTLWDFKGNNFLCNFLSNNKTRYLGKISYGIYLLHYPVTNLFDKLLEKTNYKLFSFFMYHSILHLFVYIILTILAAIISWNYIESYFLKLKTRFNY